MIGAARLCCAFPLPAVRRNLRNAAPPVQKLWRELAEGHFVPDMQRRRLQQFAPGGSPKGAERIAACWAEARKVTQISFKPSWTKHANAAPFRLNDDMLSIMPVGVIIFPGSGIIGNLADKARRLGIPVWQAAEDGA